MPYKGGGPVVLAMLAGQVTMLFATMPSAMPQVKAGPLKALAVTSRKWSSAAPDLPTMVEAGVKDFELEIWIGVLVPKGAAMKTVGELNGAIRRAIESAAVNGKLRAGGYEPIGSTPSEMANRMKAERKTWAPVIQAAGIAAD